MPHELNETDLTQDDAKILYSNIIEVVIEALEKRFPEQEIQLYKSLDCLRPRSDHFLNWGKIRPLWQYYSALLPEEHICMADRAYLKVVGQQIQGSWKTANDVLLFLSKFGSDLFCVVRTFYKIGKTLPVSTATCERAFSRLRLVKSELRTLTSDHRLNALILPALNRDIVKEWDLDGIVDDFKTRKNRRIQL